MSAKLDQSLEEILSTRPKTSGRRGGRGSTRRAAQSGRTATATAPSNGVKKNTNTAPRGGRGGAVPTGPALRQQGGGKILVSNLPKDVNEAQIKEYFVKSVGPIKRVELSYGPNSISRGVATITFVRPESAAKALKELNGLLVDGRPMTIEMMVDAQHAPALVPQKSLGDRIQQKSQPKSAANTKNASNAKSGDEATRGRKRGGRGAKAGNSSRPVKKTAEELDSEMADYFTSTADAAPATNGTAADNAMVDEVL